MTMPLLDDLLNAVCASLATISGVKDCDLTGGRFDLGELRKFAVKAPAIRVACLGIAEVRQADTGEFDARASIGAFIVTKDGTGVSRETQALLIVPEVIKRSQLGRWGTLKVHPGRDVSAENLYSGTLQSTGASIWGVAWKQGVRLGDDFAAAAEAGTPVEQVLIRPHVIGEAA